MRERSWKLVAADEPAVIAKPLLDAVVVEESKSDRRLSDPPCTDEGDGCEVFGKTNDLLDQLIASETGPRWRWRRLSGCARYKYKVLDSLVVEAADLVCAG